jgi:hypothetical protein
MSLIDFAENYIFMDFNEIREIYWYTFQLIILAHVSYRWNLAYISDVNSGVKKLITEYQYISFLTTLNMTLCLYNIVLSYIGQNSLILAYTTMNIWFGEMDV